MCQQCDSDVSRTGTHLDRLIASELDRRKRNPRGLSSQQEVMRLTSIILEALMSEDVDTSEGMCEMAMGFATAVTRLVAVQEIYGIVP